MISSVAALRLVSETCASPDASTRLGQGVQRWQYENSSRLGQGETLTTTHKLRDEIARPEVPGSQNERSSPGTEPHSCKLCFRQLVGQGGPCGADSLWDKVVHVVAGICSLRRSACIQGGRDLHEVNGATRALHEVHARRYEAGIASLGSLGSEPYPVKMKLLGVSPGSSRRAL